MKRSLLLVLAAAACIEDGSPPAPTAPTRLLLTVTYSESGVDELRITGTALTQNRSFGPFDSKGSEVRSGATIGLLFDPADAGIAHVCVEGRAAGATAASACGDFPVTANALSMGTLDLQNAPADGMACSDLAACCHDLHNTDEIVCQATAQHGDAAACAATLDRFKQMGSCR